MPPILDGTASEYGAPDEAADLLHSRLALLKLAAFAATLICGAAVLLGGCAGPAESVSSPSNSEYRVETLFHHEGCTVYRFDDGRTVHYVKCGSDVRTAWREGCGKNCTRPVAVQTAMVEGGP